MTSMREYIDVAPSNGSGTASYKDGNPIVNFIIGAQDRFLLGSTVRLNGKFTAYNSADETGATLKATDPNIAMEPRLGVFSAIDSLAISSAMTSQTIEHIKHYPRMLASYIPVTSSVQDLTGHMGINALTAADVNAGQQTQVWVANSEFSIPLPCGFFLGQNPIPLAQSFGVKGVNIQINLSPDSNIFFDPTGGNAAVGAYYKLTELRLTAELVTPPPDQLSQLMKRSKNAFEYNSISSYYATINQSYATVNFNLGLKNVLAVWTNLIPSSHINNAVYNSLATHEIRDSTSGVQPIKELYFTRGSKRFPNEYIVDTMQKDDSSIVGHDPQITRSFMNSVVPYSKLARTTVSPYNTPGKTTADSDLPDGGNIFGVGVALDTISNVGVDYTQEQFGMVINSTLSTDTPHSCFVYVRAKQTLLMNQQGIEVVS
jgi:hypothetical protein